MSVQSGFFEAEWDPELYNEETHTYGDWDRKYLAEQFARYFSKLVSNGVMNDTPNQLKVSVAGGMKVSVSIGLSFMNGFWCYNDEPLELSVPLNETPSTRYDSVRVRWNATLRKVEIIYITDNITNVRNDLYYDLQLAQVKIDPAVSSITDDDITDVRGNEELCGLINIAKASDIGDLSLLETSAKSSLVAAINSFAWSVLKNKPFVSLDSDNFSVDQSGKLSVTFSPEAAHATNADNATNATNATNAAHATAASSTDNDFILKNQQALSFSNKVCTISDSRITANSLADVYFTQACMNAATKASIIVETSAGKLTLTAARTPEATLTATIKIRVV